ncbi:MAG: hypothetical protein Q8Q23_03395 [bacterium]|nr:hypothetical protein [bacterium]
MKGLYDLSKFTEEEKKEPQFKELIEWGEKNAPSPWFGMTFAFIAFIFLLIAFYKMTESFILTIRGG